MRGGGAAASRALCVSCIVCRTGSYPASRFPVAARYIRIAAMLPHKTVRDVACELTRRVRTVCMHVANVRSPPRTECQGLAAAGTGDQVRMRSACGRMSVCLRVCACLGPPCDRMHARS